MKHLSLRSKLLIVFIVLALIPLGISGRTMLIQTRDELMSAQNDELLLVANQISETIDDFYYDTWAAPLLLIRTALDDPRLGINEILSLLYTGTTEITDLVAIQLTVEGARPAVASNEEFTNRLESFGLDPSEVLRVPPEQVFGAEIDGNIGIGELTHVPEADVWLLNLLMPLENGLMGRRTVLSAQINLERLRERIESHSFLQHGSIYIIDSHRHPLFTTHLDSLDENEMVRMATERLESEIRTATLASFHHEDGEEMLGAFAYPQEFQWAVIVETSTENAYYAVNLMFWNLMIWLGVGFVIAVGGAIIFSYTLTKPLLRLTKAANTLASGDLSTKVEGAVRRDEIGSLASSFNKMVDDLNQYIYQLQETTKQKERAESELKLARNIQQSFLPKSFPELDEIEIFGLCDPALEVGGDYFDVFPIDDSVYGFVIGDVSGKGVPAALFMAVSRTLFRMISVKERMPDLVLSEFNDRMVELDEGANLFITIFYGVYELKTGVLTYSTAGHNMPYLYQKSHAEKGFQMLPSMSTLVAGMIEDIPVERGVLQMQPGDILYMYTDGMTEAINKDNEEFGDDDLMDYLNHETDKSMEEICQSSLKKVKDFQKGMPQFDDMTLLGLKVKEK